MTARSATLAVSVAASVTLAALATIPVRADTAQDVKSAKGRVAALGRARQTCFVVNWVKWLIRLNRFPPDESLNQSLESI